MPDHAPPRHASFWTLAPMAGVLAAAAGLALILVQSCPAQTVPAKPRKPTTTSPEPPTAKDSSAGAAASSVGALQTLPGAVVIICDKAADAFRQVPRGVLLAPETYQQLLGQIRQLTSKLQSKAMTPAVCTLSGRVDHGVVEIEAEFEFTTSRPQTRVALGCQHALPRSATLDGQLPELSSGDDGLLVQVEKPGVHRLALALQTAATSTKTGSRGFDITLPRAAITKLRAFEAPPSVAALQVNGRTLATHLDKARVPRVSDVLLGAADRLELSWKAPPAVAVHEQGQPLTAADATVVVHVDETQVTTDAEMTLRVLRGKVGAWRLYVPAGTRIDLKDRDDGTRIVPPTASNPVTTIEREPSAEPMVLHLHHRQVRPGDKFALIPWYLEGALRQQGTITVTAAPDLIVQFQAHGDVLSQEIPDTQRPDALASFSYWNLPKPPAAPLDFEVGRLKGWIETRVSQDLRLAPERGWQLTTRIEAVPVRTGAERLDVRLPAGFHYHEGVDVIPASLLLENPPEIKEVDGQKTIRIRLRRQRNPFSITLTGIYPLKPGEHRATLLLPRPVGTQERAGQVAVVLPEGQELVSAEGAADRPAPGTREQTWRSDRAPLQAVLTWRPYRPELAARIQADVTLTNGRAWVQERLQFPATGRLPRSLFLTVPAELRAHVELTADGKAVELSADGLVLGIADATRAQSLTASFGIPLPEMGAAGRSRPFVVPLLRPRDASRLDTHVFFYSDAGTEPESAGGPWDEAPIEATTASRLPTLVLRGHSLEAPLVVRALATPETRLVGFFVDRALVQVAVDGSGGQVYRARYVAERPGVRRLDIEFPAPVALINPHVFVQGKEITRFIPGSNDEHLSFSLTPDNRASSAVLEIRYQLGPDLGGNGLLKTVVRPPVLHGSVLMGPVRWEISLPFGWTSVYDSGYSWEEVWDWHGVLWVPRPAATSEDLEQWLQAPRNPTNLVGLPELHHNRIVCWGLAQDGLAIVHMPEPAWLLVCSVVFLVLGLGLFYLRMARALLVLALVVLATAGVAAGLLWPSALLAVLYGCEPGVAALAVIGLLHWLLHRRHQRQVVFLPAFTRARSGSSLIRASRPAPVRGEPSTVDVPPDRALLQPPGDSPSSMEASRKQGAGS